MDILPGLSRNVDLMERQVFERRLKVVSGCVIDL